MSIGLEGKRVFVAGGSGLIGSNLVTHLAKLGARVSASYYMRSSPALNLKRYDFTDFDQCLAATKDTDYVFLCAAQTYGVEVMKENPTLLIGPNLKINLNLLEASFHNKVKKAMFISSSTVYQEAQYPIKEDELSLDKPPFSLYFGVGWMKRYIEQLCLFYNTTYAMNINIVRPTNVYGPGDKFEDGKSHVIPALIKRALRGEDPFIVWGSANTVRDFIYVEDFVADILQIFMNFDSIEPLNVCSGEKITIREVAEIILEECKIKPRVIFDQTKPDAIPFRLLNNEKFKSLFGVPHRTPFREGIRKTILWYKATSKYA